MLSTNCPGLLWIGNRLGNYGWQTLDFLAGIWKRVEVINTDKQVT